MQDLTRSNRGGVNDDRAERVQHNLHNGRVEVLVRDSCYSGNDETTLNNLLIEQTNLQMSNRQPVSLYAVITEWLLYML